MSELKALQLANRTTRAWEDKARELQAENERLRKALEMIRDEGWVENCLDPQRPARLAREALETT